MILSSCANKIEVPKKIELEAPKEPTTVVVRHEIVISIEMEQLFQDDCTALLGSSATKEEIDLCVKTKENKFIADFLALIEQTNNTGGQ
jgi:hypothetical protein